MLRLLEDAIFALAPVTRGHAHSHLDKLSEFGQKFSHSADKLRHRLLRINLRVFVAHVFFTQVSVNDPLCKDAPLEGALLVVLPYLITLFVSHLSYFC